MNTVHTSTNTHHRHFAAAAAQPGTSHLPQALAYRHPGVIERIADTLNVNGAEAALIFLEAKRFIWLCGVSDEILVPSPTIDEGWHAFVLHTRDYAVFCEQYIGRFIHHQPHTRAERAVRKGGHDAYKRTQTLAREVFGSSLSNHWAGHADSSTNCSGSTNCQAPYR